LRPVDAGLWDLDWRGRRFLNLWLRRLGCQLGSGWVAHVGMAGVGNDGIWHTGLIFHRSQLNLKLTGTL